MYFNVIHFRIIQPSDSWDIMSRVVLPVGCIILLEYSNPVGVEEPHRGSIILAQPVTANHHTIPQSLFRESGGWTIFVLLAIQ